LNCKSKIDNLKLKIRLCLFTATSHTGLINESGNIFSFSPLWSCHEDNYELCKCSKELPDDEGCDLPAGLPAEGRQAQQVMIVVMSFGTYKI